jgi:hypothetical protein
MVEKEQQPYHLGLNEVGLRRSCLEHSNRCCDLVGALQYGRQLLEYPEGPLGDREEF